VDYRFYFNLKYKQLTVNIIHLVERRASNRKVAKTLFNSRCGSDSLCLWNQEVCTRRGVPALQKYAKRTVLCWSDWCNATD